MLKFDHLNNLKKKRKKEKKSLKTKSALLHSQEDIEAIWCLSSLIQECTC